jgi:hypothetical protein
MNPSEILFAADRMLGRLARMLRLLGYDTLYAPDATPPQLLETARRGERVVLTRGDASKRFPRIEKILSLKSDSPPEQLREVVEKFGLDTQKGLWTRCTLCNGSIHLIEKAAAAKLVPPKVFELYEEFYRCSACEQVYWRGSHVARILKNLASLLSENRQGEI